MRLGYWVKLAVWLLMTGLACGQTNQQPPDSQSTTQPAAAQSANSQPAKSSSTNSQSANQRSTKPSAVAAAASASKLARESAPPSKVIRNHDLKDGSNASEADKSQPKPSDTAAQTASYKTTQQEEIRKVRQFEAQGKTFQNQIKVEKGKVIEIQNRITSLKNQFATWSAEFSQADEASVCWTSSYSTPYYNEWCNRGRNLKAQYDASQLQLTQEKARLEQMQENIRRAGYGNAVYDPD
jgi:DNA polymerase III gamma/tau subunit